MENLISDQALLLPVLRVHAHFLSAKLVCKERANEQTPPENKEERKNRREVRGGEGGGGARPL